CLFSSRGRDTGWPRDWSSDVCSSDLQREAVQLGLGVCEQRSLRSRLSMTSKGSLFTDAQPKLNGLSLLPLSTTVLKQFLHVYFRSEERRVGKESRPTGG